MAKHKKKASIPAPEPEQETYQVEVLTKARVVPISDDEDSDDEEYRDKRKKRKGKNRDKPSAKWEYFVKWAGYDSDANSWEPQENVANCQRLLASFWAHIGTDNNDYPVGHMVEASEKWIRKEKKLFAEEFSDEAIKQRKRREREERERMKKSKKRRRSSSVDISQASVASTSNVSKVVISSDSDDSDVALATKIRLPAKRKSTSTENDVVPLIRIPPRKTMKTSEVGYVVTDDGITQGPEMSGNNVLSSITINKGVPEKSAQLQHSSSITPVLPPKVPGVATDKAKQNAVEEPTSHAPSPDPDPASLFSAPSSPVGPPTANLPPGRPIPPPIPKSSSAKTTPTLPPKIPRRQVNPHLKLAEMAPRPALPGSGISTKQRLAQGALAPTLPKSVAPPVNRARPAVAPVKTSNLMGGLSFKKKPQTPVLSTNGSTSQSGTESIRVPGMSQPDTERNKTTLSALNMALSPNMPLLDLRDAPPAPISPQDYVMHDPDPSPFTGDDGTISSGSAPPPIKPVMTETDIFLQSVMPAALAAPLTPNTEDVYEPVPPRPLVSHKVIPQRIPKKWKWSGSVYIDSPGSEPLCDVDFCDLTDPLPNGLRFSVATAAMERLELPSFHDIADLTSILLACKPAQQLARLAPQGTKDIGPLTTLSSYMARYQKVILVPVSLDDNIVAHILLFPHVMGSLIQRFRVPPDIQKSGSLVAALIPWSLSPKQIAHEWRRPPSSYLPANVTLKPMMADHAKWRYSIRTKPIYQHAIRILQFPRALHEFLSEGEHDRRYYIWWGKGSTKKKTKAGLETLLLSSIMEQCRAKYEFAGARVIFIHVGAIKILSGVPTLLELRTRSPSAQFYTYGTHESVLPEYWGIREIYPHGGVVTFTPRAILQDPLGVSRRIKQIQEHPLWTCYIHPAALGMAIKIYAEGNDPVEMLNNGKFAFWFLLKAINDGHMSLIYAPPHDRTPTKTNPEWIVEHFSRRPLTPHATLEACLRAFNTKYSNVQESNWTSKIEPEICRDLLAMQQHPAIMNQYRRYVIIQGRDNQTSHRSGVEWSTAGKFDFKDDYIKGS